MRYRIVNHMKLAITIFLLFAMASAASAQSLQQQKVDSVFVQVKKYFNQKNADAIYNLAGDGFQKELSIDAFQGVANKNLFPLGEIRESSLVSFVNNHIATYKLKFDSITLQLLMSLDKKDKLELFLFQQYADPGNNKTALVPTSNPLKTDMDKAVDSVARIYIQKANTVGLCIGIVKDGKTTTYSYGETIKGNHKLPTNDNFFEIGSITKTFTATLLAYYVNQGKVKLTDPITNYLPDSVAANPELQNITLLSLSNHTSGLDRIPDNLVSHATDPLNPYKDYTESLLYAYLKTCKLNSKPGERYAYSNLAVGLLGSVLESVSGEIFDRMVHEVICKPLGMFNTSQYLNPLLAPGFVQVYNATGQPTEPWDFDVLAPCGALRSTMNDMLTYAKANLHPGTNEISKAITLTHQITFNKDVKIALAWHIIKINGIEYYAHDGGTNGSSSFLAFNAEHNTAVVILSNAMESVNATAADILKKIQ
jgi:CubicO group peptidase (beta-lactamase class C family)